MAISKKPHQLALTETIEWFCAESPFNRHPQPDGQAIFDAPLVGFAAGDDPLFMRYKEIIGQFHQTPMEALLQAERPAPAGGSAVSIVSWVLPVTKATRQSNRILDEGPSPRWHHTRLAGEAFNDHLRRHVVGFLKSYGFRAAAPVLSPHFQWVSLANGPASTWSERHIAFAAGLGTFSLSDGLITARGIAHRIGSVVCSASFEPTPRCYQDYREYCLFAHDGSCGMCIQRCPAGAITEEGHDKNKCNAYQRDTLKSWSEKPEYAGKTISSCGLCQVCVPCEDRIP